MGALFASWKPIKFQGIPENWARLIQKFYEVEPLTCPKCRGTMWIISFLEDWKPIQTILKHLGLWLVKSRAIPKAHAPPAG